MVNLIASDPTAEEKSSVELAPFSDRISATYSVHYEKATIISPSTAKSLKHWKLAHTLKISMLISVFSIEKIVKK